jgi:hypothetical protein
MRTFAAACAACVIAGCATGPRDDGPSSVVRTRPPSDYQGTVADWFDLMTPGPALQRRLAFGEPEASDCALYGSGGMHQGWMVPVIYDTTPPRNTAAASRKGAATGKTRTSAATAPKTSGSGTASAPVNEPAASDGVASATLEEVKISGKGYFFWFSSDTIAAVTRRADGCPP